MNDKRRATTYNNYNNIIIMTALARLIITKHQIAISSNFESFNIRLLSAIIIMLSKIESKAQDNKRALNSEFNHFSFSSDLDLIINFSARDIRKRLKHINISNQSIFKPKSFISLTAFISSLSFILSDQRVFKFRSFTFFIFINIIRKQVKVAFLKIRSNKRIFERDFSHYNKTLNKTFR